MFSIGSPSTPNDRLADASTSPSFLLGPASESYPGRVSKPADSLLSSSLAQSSGPDPAKDLLYTVADLFKDFPNDDVCLEYIKEQIWPNGVTHCQKCGVTRKHYRVSGRKAYACNHCGRHIYPLAETIFSKSTTPLTTWFYILYLLLSTDGRLSARQIQRETGVTYKTAWRSRAQILELLQAEPSSNGDVQL